MINLDGICMKLKLLEGWCKSRLVQLVMSVYLFVVEKSVNSMSEFANINGMNILDIYLNSRLRRENSSSTEFILVPTYYQRTT